MLLLEIVSDIPYKKYRLVRTVFIGIISNLKNDLITAEAHKGFIIAKKFIPNYHVGTFSSAGQSSRLITDRSLDRAQQSK